MIRWGRAKQDAWSRRSKQDQVEASTRWMIFGSPWIFYLSGMPQLSSAVEGEQLPLALTGLIWVLGLAQCVLSVGGLRQGLDHYLGEGPAPRSRLRIMAVLAGVSIAALAALIALGEVQKVTAPAMVLFATFPGVTNVYGLMVRPRHGAKVLTYVMLGITVLFAAVGMEWPGLLGTFVVGVVVAFMGVFTPRSSGWYLAVMREVSRAKETQARLAVAEERLRFSRDLHDVVGRNLSVIALKSELAAQLAQRGASGVESAVAQMTEVQQIARESQTEVREVVRGYREASLHTELAGARGVLRAAGVDCRIEEDHEEMPDRVQSALGWVVREGATNVLRHAEATRCRIRVGAGDGGATAVLEMENDGVRVPRAECGSGLTGLRERLAAVDGTLSAEREESTQVFRLRAEIPLAGGPSGGDVGDTDTDAHAGANAGAGADTGTGAGADTGSTGTDAVVVGADAGAGEGPRVDAERADAERVDADAACTAVGARTGAGARR
ncbi:sensor histidine kinase [Streptomyces iconiensis]|uniref:Histidine kinase n=1 Tax=Streptomyces iconiensis TaxID=1384038 RepID=A0ABT7A062_9ACTN|nr:histidine kinase [Streptomyces iconiensis]MDJ1134721.1 histidine kinase [Streptomyces iconiensis]